MSQLVNRLLTQVPTDVEIRIGPSMDEEVAKATFAHLVEGTHLAGLAVTWRRAHDLLNCLDCDADYSGAKVDPCPVCGGNGLVVEAAPDVYLVGEPD